LRRAAQGFLRLFSILSPLPGADIGVPDTAFLLHPYRCCD
jgi:hypothetical protein